MTVDVHRPRAVAVLICTLLARPSFAADPAPGASEPRTIKVPATLSRLATLVCSTKAAGELTDWMVVQAVFPKRLPGWKLWKTAIARDHRGLQQETAVTYRQGPRTFELSISDEGAPEHPAHLLGPSYSLRGYSASRVRFGCGKNVVTDGLLSLHQFEQAVSASGVKRAIGNANLVFSVGYLTVVLKLNLARDERELLELAAKLDLQLLAKARQR